MSNRWMICVPCRYACRRGRLCPHCRTELREMPRNWRVPAKSNDAAWEWLAAHPTESLWDRDRVARADHSQRLRSAHGVTVCGDRRLTPNERRATGTEFGRYWPHYLRERTHRG
jgi:hypothetical protein